MPKPRTDKELDLDIVQLHKSLGAVYGTVYALQKEFRNHPKNKLRSPFHFASKRLKSVVNLIAVAADQIDEIVIPIA